MQNSDKKQSKRQKRTHMTGAELIRLREEMGLQPRHMYRIILKGLCRRTYQDYEAGKRGIPETVAAMVREAHAKDREFMANIPAILDKNVIPAGIRSESGEDWS